MSRFFAIKQYWPDLKVAEHEALVRIESAMDKLGFTSIRIDQNGNKVGTGVPIAAGEAEFCLDLHFLTPKVFPGVSVAALWNPPDFYELFGLEQSISNQISHDVFVAANPKMAKAWLEVVNPAFSGEILTLNHTVGGDFLPPLSEGPEGFFYIGIGWDKTAGQGQRHARLLKAIAAFGKLSIFGPEVLADNSRPWSNFGDSYKGALPFDGYSVIESANKSGLALALSSESHLSAGISSNRLFESIAAGCLPVIERTLQEPFDLSEAIKIDTSLSPKSIAEFLQTEMLYLQNNPSVFQQRVSALQAKMLAGFTLELQLQAIIARVEELTSRDSSVQLTSGSVCASAISIFREYLGRQPEEILKISEVRKFSTSNFTKFLFDSLTNSSAEWVSFSNDEDYLAQVETLLNNRGSGHGVDAYHFRGVWKPAGKDHTSVGISPDQLDPGRRVLDSFIVRKEVVLSWISHESRLFSVSSLLTLLHFDRTRSLPSFEHSTFSSPSFVVSGDDVLNLAGLLDEKDRYVLSRGRLANLEPVFAALLDDYADVNFASAVGNSLPIMNYKVILASMAKMPLAEIPHYFKLAIGMVFRRIRNAVRKK